MDGIKLCICIYDDDDDTLIGINMLLKKVVMTTHKITLEVVLSVISEEKILV